MLEWLNLKLGPWRLCTNGRSKTRCATSVTGEDVVDLADW